MPMPILGPTNRYPTPIPLRTIRSFTNAQLLDGIYYDEFNRPAFLEVLKERVPPTAKFSSWVLDTLQRGM